MAPEIPSVLGTTTFGRVYRIWHLLSREEPIELSGSHPGVGAMGTSNRQVATSQATRVQRTWIRRHPPANNPDIMPHPRADGIPIDRRIIDVRVVDLSISSDIGTWVRTPLR